MRNTYEVLFAKGAPPIEAVLDRLQQVTGLPLVYENLTISNFAYDLQVTIVDSEGGYELFKHDPIIDYLLGNTLFTLTLLGGTYAGLLPAWVGTAWVATTQP